VSDLEIQIDALYALPPDAFTAARNALARTLKGDDAARVKRLQKPTSVPWAVNQLYWHDRAQYETLMAAGRALRAVQVAALHGAPADLRSAGTAHRTALAEAVAAAGARAATAGVAPSAEAIARMLEALSLAPQEPAPAGRFTEVIGPQGFEALAGIAPLPPSSGGTALGHASATRTTPPPHSATEKRQREAAEAAARDAADRAVAEAARQLRDAEQRETRVQAQVEFARQQLERSEASLREARVSVESAAAALTRAEAERARL
jgi:hypothetical protein